MLRTCIYFQRNIGLLLCTWLSRQCPGHIHQADLVALTQALVRIPTVNPPGENYREICELITARLVPRGFACAFVRAEGAPGDSERFPRWNLVARREGARSGPCIHFNGHIDVVEVGRDWTRDPFGAELDGGRIYGRGTCDMKGGLAAAIVAVEAFLAVHPAHPGAIEISATADEETGGYGGVAHLARRGAFDRVDAVIIPEPLNKERICLGHRGVWWAELETFGRIAHGSMPFLGDCAVRHMGAVIAEMEATLWPALAARWTAMPVVPPAARASTLNVNSLHGGQAEPEPGFDGWPSPVVPDRCRMVIDRRFLAEEAIADVKAEFRATVERAEFLEPGEVTEYHIQLAPTSNVFLAGHRLRVEISSSNFPRFDRNLNTGEPFATSTRMQIAHQTVLHTQSYPSHILLPVIPA